MRLALDLSLSGLPVVLNGGGAPYDPIAALGANLLCWWDADHADLITRAGGFVSSWADRVTGFALTAAGAMQPQYLPTAFNGRPSVVFDGVDDVLTGSGLPPGVPSGSNPVRMFVLIDQQALATDTTQNPRLAFAYGGNVANSRRLQRLANTGVNRGEASQGNGTSGVSALNRDVDLTGRHVMQAIIAADSVSVIVDNAPVVTTAVTPATNTDRTRIGGSTASPTSSNYWLGGVAAVLICAFNTPQVQLDGLHAWLMSRR
ncbi:hypothetical protein QTA58_00160 [Neorhizobium sp. CSC1952]|uniref:hypothetical protein n=1 Tax=Neorhizobium sp. CSC1952 TaxID=2978974 RepID=UPI0025A57ADE|nr:hypothetical protein [Rhizobium sp. CSC1952]WJR67193.1 hypothetical protein QTA58_23940 [Rhizobium sp. CSC1952]WJR67222.1 hypothetical protein QTA58_00160 [Rhizobium sp. CSC1952]